MRIGFSYNLKDAAYEGTDEHAEYESAGTIDAVASSLARFGEVVHYPCDGHLLDRVREKTPDIIFNIAEGWGGRDRESFTPVICDMLDIPYTGSDAVALGVTMDKALTKRIAQALGIRTARWIVYRQPPDSAPPFGFPMFVKPLWDGSSRGIFGDSVVYDMDGLRARVVTILDTYRQPAIVEEYLDGRDFCVGLLGNGEPDVLTTCEVLLGHEDGIPFFSHEYKRRDRDRLDMSPDLKQEKIESMERDALLLWHELGLRDYTRFDFRTGADGVPHLLEINALPGLSPISGIFVREAEHTGIDYDELIGRILERIMCVRGIMI